VAVTGLTAKLPPQEAAAQDEMIQEALRRFDGHIVT